MEGKPTAMTREGFRAFLDRRLFPKLKPGDVLVMDNLSAHRGASIWACACK